MLHVLALFTPLVHVLNHATASVVEAGSREVEETGGSGHDLSSVRFKLTTPGLPAELWDACHPDNDTDEPVEDEHHAHLNHSGCVYAREQFQDIFQGHSTTVRQSLAKPR